MLAMSLATPAQKCSASKMRCMARNFTTVVGCHARAVLQGATASAGCLDGAANAFTRCWNAAEAKGGCIAIFPSDHLNQDIVDWTTDMVGDLPAS
jgi:hypothetical protein